MQYAMVFGAGIIGSICAMRKYPLEIKGTFTQWLFTNFPISNNKIPQKIFKWMVRYTLLTNSGSLNLSDKILTGIDEEGRLLDGLAELGIGGVEIGPISLNSSQKSSKSQHLGLLYSKSLIKTFYDDHNQTKLQHLGINITADSEIVQYAPYIFDQNITNSIRQLADYPQCDLNFITVNTTSIKNTMKSFSEQQYTKLVNKTFTQAKQVIQQNNGFVKYLFLQEQQNGKRQLKMGNNLNQNLTFITFEELIELIKNKNIE